jgi:hypothetical protein
MVLGALLALGFWFYCHHRHSRRMEVSRQYVLDEPKTASISIAPWSVPEIANHTASFTISAPANNYAQFFGSEKARMRNQMGQEAYTAIMPPMPLGFDSYSNDHVTASPPPFYGPRE